MYPTNTTITAQYAAVAENISWLRECVNQDRAEEKTMVKAVITHSLDGIACAMYRTTIGIANARMAKAVVKNLEIIWMRS